MYNMSWWHFVRDTATPYSCDTPQNLDKIRCPRHCYVRCLRSSVGASLTGDVGQPKRHFGGLPFPVNLPVPGILAPRRLACGPAVSERRSDDVHVQNSDTAQFEFTAATGPELSLAARVPVGSGSAALLESPR